MIQCYYRRKPILNYFTLVSFISFELLSPRTNKDQPLSVTTGGKRKARRTPALFGSLETSTRQIIMTYSVVIEHHLPLEKVLTTLNTSDFIFMMNLHLCV